MSKHDLTIIVHFDDGIPEKTMRRIIRGQDCTLSEHESTKDAPVKIVIVPAVLVDIAEDVFRSLPTVKKVIRQEETRGRKSHA